MHIAHFKRLLQIRFGQQIHLYVEQKIDANNHQICSRIVSPDKWESIISDMAGVF